MNDETQNIYTLEYKPKEKKETSKGNCYGTEGKGKPNQYFTKPNYYIRHNTNKDIY